MIVLSYNRKLRFLQQYMDEWIDAYPKKIKPFESWLESLLDKRAHKGNKAHIETIKKVCRYCRRNFLENFIDKTKDHIIPVSKGGLNIKENKVPCCYDCNQWKKDKMPEDWLKELQAIIKKEKRIKLPYDKNMVGLMIGNLKSVINLIQKSKVKISIYKI